MPDYLVLRNLSAVKTASPFESFGPGAAEARAPAAPEPRVEVHDISTREANSIARDLEVAAVAIPMPITLINPFDVGGSAAATDAWGIPAVKSDISTFTGDGVVVAVLESGVDKTHPATMTAPMVRFS